MAAHISGVIHRDLKPDNTFLVHHSGEKPAVKLLDFGLAKLADTHSAIIQCDEEDSDEDAYSDSGLVFGTPLYISPEQARGFYLDRRSDIYALGCVAYELVLGARPFPEAQTTTAICAAHLHSIPLLPQSIWPEIPPQLDLLLFAMLAKDPSHRPTLAQLRSVIADLRTSTPSQQTATVPVGPQLPNKTTMRTAITVIAAIAILAAGAMLGITVSSAIRARSPSTQHHPTVPTISTGNYPRG